MLLMYFYYVAIISSYNRTWPFIWTNWNHPLPRMLCAKFGWNWPRGSGEEDNDVKSYNNNNGQNYDQKSSLELKWVKYQVIFYNVVSTYLSWLHIWNLASNLAVDKSSSPFGSFLCVCSGYLPENLQYLKIQ